MLNLSLYAIAALGSPDASPPAALQTISIWSESGVGGKAHELTITSDGKVDVTGQGCVGCRWHAPYQYSFTMPADAFGKIEQLLDADTMMRAQSLPCVMPNGFARVRKIGISWKTFYAHLSIDCRSKAMDQVKAKLDSVQAILDQYDPSPKKHGSL
jgi:hypothetical protein